MRNDEQVWQSVDARKDDYAAFSDRVWEMPEIAYTETRSVAEHIAMLEKEGARITKDALDAVELMNVGVNYMREHMPDHARIHYAMLDGGGIAPNVVQSRAKVRYLIRARDLPELNGLVERVRKIAQGAALMTETTVETAVVSAQCSART